MHGALLVAGHGLGDWLGGAACGARSGVRCGAQDDACLICPHTVLGGAPVKLSSANWETHGYVVGGEGGLIEMVGAVCLGATVTLWRPVLTPKTNELGVVVWSPR